MQVDGERAVDLLSDLILAVQGIGRVDLAYTLKEAFQAMVGRPPTEDEMKALDCD